MYRLIRFKNRKIAAAPIIWIVKVEGGKIKCWWPIYGLPFKLKNLVPPPLSVDVDEIKKWKLLDCEYMHKEKTYEKYKEAEDAISFVEDEGDVTDVISVEVLEAEIEGHVEAMGFEVVEAEGPNSLVEDVQRDIQGMYVEVGEAENEGDVEGMGVEAVETEGENSLMENDGRDIHGIDVEVVEAGNGEVIELMGSYAKEDELGGVIELMGFDALEAELGGVVELLGFDAIEAELGGVEMAASGLVERKKHFYDLEAKSLILENYRQLKDSYIKIPIQVTAGKAASSKQITSYTKQCLFSTYELRFLVKKICFDKRDKKKVFFKNKMLHKCLSEGIQEKLGKKKAFVDDLIFKTCRQIRNTYNRNKGEDEDEDEDENEDEDEDE